MPEPVFQLARVSLNFGAKPIFRNLSLEVAPGEKVVIRGKSGTGKSTVLRLLLGFVRPNSGEIRFQGQRLTPEVAWAMRRQLAYVNQGPDFESSTVGEALTTMCRLRACDKIPEPADLTGALSKFELDSSALAQKTGDLSGGERQRVALAAATLLNREIVLLDEPTAALDESQTQLVADFFLKTEPGRTVVAVSHDEAWFRPDRATIVDLTSP